MRPHHLVLTLALALLGAGCSSADPTPAAIPGSATPAPSVAGSALSPSAVPSASGPTPAKAGTKALALYYLHDAGRGPRLYREFHPRPATTGVIRDAVTAMLSEMPYDADYSSLWPRATRVLGARVEQTPEGAVAYVDLSREALDGSAGSEAEAQSLQQLVHTVTAAAPSVRSVQLLVEGKPPATLWGHVSTSRPIARGPATDVLGAVWLLFREGIAADRGATLRGEATVFEATVSYEWVQGGRVVKRGFTNASVGAPGRGAWTVKVDVPAGRYVLRAFESSAKDGSPQHVDDKSVVVTG